jgi:hypothetical protein
MKGLTDQLLTFDLDTMGSMDMNQLLESVTEAILVKLHEYLGDQRMHIWVDYKEGDEDKQKPLVDLILVNVSKMKTQDPQELLSEMIREKAFRKNDVAECYFLTLLRKKIIDGILKVMSGTWGKLSIDNLRTGMIPEVLQVFKGEYAHGARFSIGA